MRLGGCVAELRSAADGKARMGDLAGKAMERNAGLV